MRQQYSSYDETVAFFEAAQKTHPDLFKVEYIGSTWESREILCVTISKDMKNADAKPALFYTGTIHAREWAGIELSLSFAKYILEHIEYDPRLIAILERATFYMVPCANPDGFEYSRNHFSFWRKNRRQNADGTFGVDLNRNFSVGFSPNKITSSNVYSGPSAFSEPETLALKNFVEDHPNITIALDYHSQGNVFFPAHNFIHEDALDATDLNLLAANMAEEIRKESGREYGIHMGKPPTHLISGSGREFYYSQGALSIVAEVGSRNISDYQEHMKEHLDENIPALIIALDEAPNYDKENQLKRVENFVMQNVSAKEITLTWDYTLGDVYFEIYRSKSLKGFAQNSNRIGTTKMHTFTDSHLEASTNYYYFIRSVCKKRHVKSSFAPVLEVRTEAEYNMFSKILYPRAKDIGYVGEKTQKNREHFGENSLFVGISESKGECFGVSSFSLDSVPSNAIITGARISFYPMNRVAVQVERYGEWRIGMIDERTIDSISNFEDVKNAKVLGYIDRPIGSHQLSQGVWKSSKFAAQEVKLLQSALKRGEAIFRIEGPDSLPLDRGSQMMQWDIGYGKFSGGLNFRPKLEIDYTLQEARIELQSSCERTILKDSTKLSSLNIGYDKSGHKQFGVIEFDLTQMPSIDNTIISEAYVELDVQSMATKSNLRFHLELIRVKNKQVDYNDIKNRDVIERIGYDVSVEDLKKTKHQRFVFDTFAIMEVVKQVESDERLLFVMYATSEKSFCKSQSVSWLDTKRFNRPRLVVEYIKKRRNPVDEVENLRYSIENSKIRLDWDNPSDEAFKGVIVVKNRFRVPSSPYDGQKLYGGSDNYTLDNFGAKDIKKYYAVFTYDDVPNFSKATSIIINENEE
jgi:hypothetical protein